MKGLIDFFKRLFGSLFGGKKQPTDTTTTSSPSTTTEVDPDLPQVDDNEAQDGSEITPDTAVVVMNEQEPVIVDGDTFDVTPEPATPIPPTTTNTDDTTDPVDSSTTDTTTEPPIVETPPEPPVETPPVTIGNEVPSDSGDTELPTHKPKYLWCLDNGHGKLTAGKRSPKLEDGNQLLEYEFNRDIVKRISKALDEKGVKYFNVVPEVDIDNFLEGRVSRANKKQSSIPKIFLSVHSNAAPARPGKWSDPKISGIETWYYHSNNRGRKLAAVFQKHLIDATGWKNRHIKSRAAKQFYVLRNTSMTAVLTENGFYNNKAECKQLLKDEVRQKIAQAHVDAIMEIEVWGV